MTLTVKSVAFARLWAAQVKRSMSSHIIPVVGSHFANVEVPVRIPAPSRRRKSSMREAILDTDEVEDKILPPCIAEGPEGPLTTTLDIVDTSLKIKKWPAYSVLDESGQLRNQHLNLPLIEKDLARRMYQIMCRVQALDSIFYDSQRQGRISFYMQSAGEEASVVGSAAALTIDDVIFAQYREVGALLWRGFTLQNCADQCFSNKDDLGKGRQMPVHFGSKAMNFQTISSPLATQLPQAVGAAYALKLEGKQAVAMCYFGEGAASEGDFHAALNFASTLNAPVLFFCRNNGYAISTPASEQYHGDGIISRASAYGMHGIRVDGNDAFAVYIATQAARKLAIEKSCPVLIEAMTYRRDDSTRYRSMSEIKHWQDHYDPLTRLRKYLESKGWWSAEEEGTTNATERADVIEAMEKAEKKDKPSVTKMFEDVYEELPLHLIEQEKETLEHIAKYPEYYLKDGH